MAKAKNSKRRQINWGEIATKIKEADKPTYNKDDGYSENLFTPQLKDDGTYEAIIRFLPRPESDGDGIPFVKMFNHGFQALGGAWFIENCPTTIGKDCPVCQANSTAWKAGDEDLAKSRARRQSFYSNILVIKDPQKPDNEGKVFIFRYGKKLHEKIMEKISPSGELDESVPVFDYEDGMNFKLKIKTQAGPQKFKNYDSSQFTGVATPVGDDAYIDQLETQLFTLGQIVGDDKFKAFKELETTFNKKTGSVTVQESVPEQKEQPAEKATDDADADADADEDLSEGSDFFNKLKKEAESENK